MADADNFNNLRLTRRVTILHLAGGKTAFSASELLAVARCAAGSDVIDGHMATSVAATRYAYAIGRKKPAPTFLPGATLQERRYSLAFLVAHHEFLVAFLAGGATIRETTLKRRYVRLPVDEAGRLPSTDSDEKLRGLELTNMSIAPNAVHKRSYHGEDIAGSMPSAAQHRQVPDRIETTLKGVGRRLTNLATGHVSESGGALDAKQFLVWACRTVDRIRDATTIPHALLHRFAQPARFADLAADGIEPVGALLDTSWLREQVEEEGWYGELAVTNGEPQRFSTNALVELLADISRSCTLTPTSKKRRYEFGLPATATLVPALVPKLQVNKASISVLGRVTRLKLCPPTGETSTLAEQLRSRPSLLVTMTSPEYAYMNGRLFKDGHFKSMLPQLQSILFPVPQLGSCTDEKGGKNGALDGGRPVFEPTSVFRVVEDHISEKSSLLACDDMGDEWADFVEVLPSVQAPTVTFLHAKHNPDGGLGASPLQEVVAQALKNVGRLNLTSTDLEPKRASWGGKWMGKSVPRLRRGGSPDLFADALLVAATHSQATKRVCIVTTALSQAELGKLFKRVTDDEALLPHEVQLLHLLMSFTSACAEVSAQPRVYVKP